MEREAIDDLHTLAAGAVCVCLDIGPLCLIFSLPSFWQVMVANLLFLLIGAIHKSIVIYLAFQKSRHNATEHDATCKRLARRFCAENVAHKQAMFSAGLAVNHVGNEHASRRGGGRAWR